MTCSPCRQINNTVGGRIPIYFVRARAYFKFWVVKRPPDKADDEKRFKSLTKLPYLALPPITSRTIVIKSYITKMFSL